MNASLIRLRTLAASDPKAARQMIDSLLDGESNEMERVLNLLEAPDEGRLRQLVANTVRRRSDRDKVIPHLLRWIEHESDEFARLAIQAALEGVDVSQRRRNHAADPPALVQTYRYVAGRLCHKVRNALPGPMTHLRRIEELANQNGNSASSELRAAAAQMRDALRMVSRIVEFDVEDGYFEWRSIRLPSWLQGAAREFNNRNEPVAVDVIQAAGSEQAVIRANEFLLETIFWNLWTNARQAVAGVCRVEVCLSIEGGRVRVLLMDNGDGLPSELVGLAFEDQVSTHGRSRGRGFLEVADAVQRIAGNVSIVDLEHRGHRVQMSFPLEDT